MYASVMCSYVLYELKLESGANLTSKDEKVLRTWMHHGGHHIHVNEQTRHLVIQKLLIDYVYKQRRSQIDAIAVCTCIHYFVPLFKSDLIANFSEFPLKDQM